MLYAVIVASEIAFWSLLVGGLYVRYALDGPRTSALMLVAAASTDLVVVAVAGLDLAGGTAAQTSHVFAALAAAYSVVYARHLVGIADRFVLRRLGREVTEPPRPPKAVASAPAGTATPACGPSACRCCWPATCWPTRARR